MEFNEKLKLLREKKNITQEELANVLYVSRTAVSKWESGKGYPSIDTLQKIAEFYEISIDELLSSNELLNLTKKNIDSSRRQTNNLIYSIIDILTCILFFIPLFRSRNDNVVESSSLFNANCSTISLILYLIGISLNIIIGLITLIYTILDNSKVLKYCPIFSILVSALLIMFFLIGRDPYPGVVILSFLIIKIALLFKK